MCKQTEQQITNLLNEYEVSDDFVTINFKLADVLELDMDELCLYHLIKRHMRYHREQLYENDGWFYWDISYIQNYLRRGRDKVRDTLKKFVSMGMFKTEKRGSQGGGVRTWYQYQGIENMKFSHLRDSSKCDLRENRKCENVSENTKSDAQTSATLYARAGAGALHNTKNIYNNKKNGLPEGDKTGKYVSKRVFKKVETPQIKKQKLPKKEENNIAPKFLIYAEEWEPRLRKVAGKVATQKQIKRAASTLQRLVEVYGYTFNELKEVIEWAHHDTIPKNGNFCWHPYFTTITGLVTVGKDNAKTKFEKMRSWYERESQNTVNEYNIDQHIEKTLRANLPKTYTEDDFEVVIEDAMWVQERLEDINTNRSGDCKFYWHLDVKFLHVVKWMAELENNSDYTFQHILKYYLQFLEYELQSGKIKTLYAGMFNNTSTTFHSFLNENYRQTGKKLLNWQRGDYE